MPTSIVQQKNEFNTLKMQYIIILKYHTGSAVPPGPQWVQCLFNEVVIQSCWRGYILVGGGIGSGPPAQGRRAERPPTVSPRDPSPVHLSPCRLQILGPTPQGYALQILHPCLSFLWPDLVRHLRTLTQGEGSLGMVTLQVMLWPGFRVPWRSPLRAPHLSLSLSLNSCRKTLRVSIC